MSYSLSEVDEEHMEWLWKNRIPSSMLSLVAGYGDVGKSTFLYDLAARISRGADWPNDEGPAPKGSVILFNREDPVKQVIKPRVMAADGKVRKIRVVEGAKDQWGKPQPFTYRDDLETLEELIQDLGDVKLVVFDPVSSYFGNGVNAWKEDQVRSVLEPMSQRAEKWGVAIIGNTHLSKDSKAGQANLKILNSVGITNLARSIYMIARDGEDQELRIIGPTKKNVLPPMPSLQFRFEGVKVGKKQIEAPRVVWEGESTKDLSDVVTALDERPGLGQRDVAKAVVRAVLHKGPVPSGEVYNAAQSAGISPRTTRRAIEDLGVLNWKDGMEGPWLSELPARGAQRAPLSP